MAKIVLAYTVFREVQLDQVDKAEIEQLQAEDQKKIEDAGFEVEDPTWELDDENSEEGSSSGSEGP
jgi:CRISPR/Cas system Type II protein with McrA/HNH and RuvC-like nuclease domain